MYGKIVKYSDRLGQGIICADDGQRLRFKARSVRNLGGKLVGSDVDFLVESRQPREIIMLSGSPWTAFGPIR